jgi:hypothetical protein
MPAKNHMRLAAVVVALLIPILVHADTITHRYHDVLALDGTMVTVDNSGGTAGTAGVGIDRPFHLSDSEINGMGGHAFTGSVSFTTGAYLGNSTLQGGNPDMWASGGSFVITTSSGAVLFSGDFSSDVSWLGSCPPGSSVCHFELTGAITGMYRGHEVSGTTTQFFTVTPGNNGGFGGTFIEDVGGFTSWTTPVPEPGSLGLLGTGVIGIAFTLKRKIHS